MNSYNFFSRFSFISFEKTISLNLYKLFVLTGYYHTSNFLSSKVHKSLKKEHKEIKKDKKVLKKMEIIVKLCLVLSKSLKELPKSAIIQAVEYYC